MAPADTFLRDVIIAAIILALVGGLAALLITRQFTEPLPETTLAQHSREGSRHGSRDQPTTSGRGRDEELSLQPRQMLKKVRTR
jgi:hypothetical protein